MKHVTAICAYDECWWPNPAWPDTDNRPLFVRDEPSLSLFWLACFRVGDLSKHLEPPSPFATEFSGWGKIFISKETAWGNFDCGIEILRESFPGTNPGIFDYRDETSPSGRFRKRLHEAPEKNLLLDFLAAARLDPTNTYEMKVANALAGFDFPNFKWIHNRPSGGAVPLSWGETLGMLCGFESGDSPGGKWLFAPTAGNDDPVAVSLVGGEPPPWPMSDEEWKTQRDAAR